MARNAYYRYEVTLACGDTVGSDSAPEWGAYRRCIHCDSRKRVVRVIDTESTYGSAQAARALAEHASQYAARSASRDATLAYAHDAGNFGSALRHIRQVVARSLTSETYVSQEALMDELRWIERTVDDSLSASLITYPGDDDEGISPNSDDDLS